VQIANLHQQEFRIWANRVLKDYLLKGYVLNQRVDRIEGKLLEHDQKFDLLIKSNLLLKEGIFYDGQIFDAYRFVSDIIKSATKLIVLMNRNIGASLKDLGKKWFTFSKIELDALEMINIEMINKLI
jgi:hypothetical protein